MLMSLSKKNMGKDLPTFCLQNIYHLIGKTFLLRVKENSSCRNSSNGRNNMESIGVFSGNMNSLRVMENSSYRRSTVYISYISREWYIRRLLLLIALILVKIFRASCSIETLVSTYKSTWRHKPEQHRHLHRRENLRSHVSVLFDALTGDQKCHPRPKHIECLF
jgi:hypothetical protein